MAEVVATMVVGPLLKILMGKASNYLLEKYKVLKGMEEQHEILMRKLPAILDIITDAEQAAAHREGAAAWLQAIKKVAYQANEVFDEFKYEALRREARKKGHYKELGFDVVKLFPTHNRFVFRNRMGRKLSKIVHAIEVLVTEMNAFRFEYKQQPPVSNQLRQKDHAIFDPNEITSKSRGKDNKKIVDMLVGQASNTDLTVLPIVGMGGLGKTTLAQLVYNEPEIQKHFDLLLWVCVSECFDVDSLAKSIVEAAPAKKDDGTKADPEKKDDGTNVAASKKRPLDSLQNVVSGKRYLLVLDDVWERQVRIWEELKAHLQHGGRGSAVLTTTRDKGVAGIISTVEPHNLLALEDKYIKEIIETRAFSRLHKERERPVKLVDMVGEFVKKCVGSPLAATALGSVLRMKTNENEWKDVLDTSSICTEEFGILPILKLSYNDLPSHMKQCFAFCAIFPKDYEIDVDKLIRLWIAHGFIHEKQAHPESIAKQIFDELVSRSFFQDVKQDQVIFDEYIDNPLCYSRTTCKIHDLMHDVALSVMEKECALATEEPGKIECVAATEEPSQSEWLQNTARHLFLSCKEPGRKMNSSLKNNSPAIQTLMCDSGDSDMHSSFHYLSKYSSLKALQLSLHRSSFPLKPKHLHHMRYLDLSRSDITTLPEDITILYNLQTLNLSGCSELETLPRQMKYMTSLRHLYTHGCLSLESMPRDLRKLTSLQTLTCFVAGSGSKCGNVGDLRHLNLGGLLELHHLEKVTEGDAEAANIVNKQDLKELTLRWMDGYSRRTSSVDDARVLEKLKPHNGLHALSISSYGGTTFPTWMSVMQNLKELTLKRLGRLERWSEVDNDRMHGEEIMYPRLEKLCIEYCGKLTELPGHPYFPNLQNARIWFSPLTTRAKSPKLSALDMVGREVELFPWVAKHMTSLTNLKLTSIEYSTETSSSEAEYGLREVLDGKEKLSDHDIPLAVLVLGYFKSGVTELCACFVHLQDLSIWSCDALVHWPEKMFEGFLSLRKLTIHNCRKLTGYTQAPVEASTLSETSQLLPRLEFLNIHECQSLVEVFNVPASLRRIEICYCNKLESISGRRVQQGQSSSSIHQGSSSIQEVSSSSLGDLAEHLGELILQNCDGLTGVLYLPPLLKKLEIDHCRGLTSLESRSGELPSLERLKLLECNTLSSLPDGPQAYSSLQHLRIRDCPGMKTLPASLQQRLRSILGENIDAPGYYGDEPRYIPILLKPKTWKYAIRRD